MSPRWKKKLPAIHERAVDSNMFRVSHFTTCCLSPKSLLFFLLSFASNGERERQQEQVEKERATEAEGRDVEGGSSAMVLEPNPTFISFPKFCGS